MTTIAARWSPIAKELEVASDTFASGNVGRVYHSKFLETPVFGGRTIVFLSGDWNVIGEVYKVLSNTRHINPDVRYEPDKAEIVSFCLDKGFEYWCGRTITRMRLANNLQSVGSGAPWSQGAMEAGATPSEAVRIACRYDPGSKPPIKAKVFSFR